MVHIKNETVPTHLIRQVFLIVNNLSTKYLDVDVLLKVILN